MLLLVVLDKDFDGFLFQEIRQNILSARKGASDPLQIAFHIDVLHVKIYDFILTALHLTMEPSKQAPQQHKQPSRKGKKAWRKNVDVTDVQTGLEEAREEVIKGLVPSIVNVFGS